MTSTFAVHSVTHATTLHPPESLPEHAPESGRPCGPSGRHGCSPSSPRSHWLGWEPSSASSQPPTPPTSKASPPGPPQVSSPCQPSSRFGLALIAVTSDHATGGIVTTLQWTPRGATLLAARTLVTVLVATGIGVALTSASALAAKTTAGDALTLHADDGSTCSAKSDSW